MRLAVSRLCSNGAATRVAFLGPLPHMKMHSFWWRALNDSIVYLYHASLLLQSIYVMNPLFWTSLPIYGAPRCRYLHHFAFNLGRSFQTYVPKLCLLASNPNSIDQYIWTRTLVIWATNPTWQAWQFLQILVKSSVWFQKLSLFAGEITIICTFFWWRRILRSHCSGGSVGRERDILGGWGRHAWDSWDFNGD